LLALELLPDEAGSPPDFKREWLEEQQWLDSHLARARQQDDKLLEERVLVQQLDRYYVHDSEGRKRDGKREELFQQLARVHPHRAAGLRLSQESYFHWERGELLATEKCLRKSIRIWAMGGRRFLGEEEAACLNLLFVQAARNKRKEVVRTADKLWNMWKTGCHCGVSQYDDDNFSWAEANTGVSCVIKDYVRTSLEQAAVKAVGETLVQMELWREAERWLKRALELSRKDRISQLSGGWRHDLIDLAELYLEMGDEAQAEATYREAFKSGDDAITAEVCIGLGKLAARRGDYRHAVKCGRHAIECRQAHLDLYKPLRYLDTGQDSLLSEMKALVSTWRKKTKTLASASKQRKRRRKG
jgi:tetratricopeptide (TPR) repeat protein